MSLRTALSRLIGVSDKAIHMLRRGYGMVRHPRLAWTIGGHDNEGFRGSCALFTSRLCTQEQMETEEYQAWCAKIGETPRLHRKQWEFCYIAQALFERGLLAPNLRGLGFGVGQEPLPALFASYGCTIVATDTDRASAISAGWVETGQHSENPDSLNARGLCSPADFSKLVRYRTVDMNAIPADLVSFDFLWSSCALEHLGSIKRGIEFICRAMNCLKPGGVAIHTTEFNVGSDTDTLTEGSTVLYRKRDIETIAKVLAAPGFTIELVWDLGQGPADRYIDVPPYKSAPHLKLQIGRYISTSIGLIMKKAHSTA